MLYLSEYANAMVLAGAAPAAIFPVKSVFFASAYAFHSRLA